MNRRLDAVDVARGLALVAMAGYHFTWDLAWFGAVDASTPFTTPMRVASHLIGGSFLALSGLSLWLAHGAGFRRRAFLKQLGKIGAAAALVTAASFWQDPRTTIWFGILHCIFAASLLAAPLIRLPAPAALAAGAALVALPFLYRSPAFDTPWLSWLGLATEDPSTLDWRPLTPWAGVTLLGLGLAKLAPPIPDWRATAAPLRALAFAGRHSLAVYLIHQPALIGLLYAVLQVSGASERISVETYRKACLPACVEAGGGIPACERACACVVRDASAAGLAGRLGSHSISKDERSRLGAIVETCGSEAK